MLAARQPGATGRRLAAFAFLSESEPKTGGDPGRDRERALEKMILAQESDIACTAIAFDARGFLGEADPDLPLVDIGHARQERACAAAVAAGRALDDDGIRVTVAAFELPLVGPGLLVYAQKVHRAAQRPMRGRWLAGAEAARGGNR